MTRQQRLSVYRIRKYYLTQSHKQSLVMPYGAKILAIIARPLNLLVHALVNPVEQECQYSVEIALAGGHTEINPSKFSDYYHQMVTLDEGVAAHVFVKMVNN